MLLFDLAEELGNIPGFINHGASGGLIMMPGGMTGREGAIEVAAPSLEEAVVAVARLIEPLKKLCGVMSLTYKINEDDGTVSTEAYLPARLRG